MAIASARMVTGDVYFATWWFVGAAWFHNADNLWFGFCRSRFVLQLLILVSLVGKGFVAVVASSRDGGGDSGSGTMFTRGFRTYISLVLVFCRWCTLFLAILVVFTVVANMVVVDFDGGVTMMEGTGGTMLLYASVLETQGLCLGSIGRVLVLVCLGNTGYRDNGVLGEVMVGEWVPDVRGLIRGICAAISSVVTLHIHCSDRSDWSWRDRSGQSGSESSGRSVEERRIPIETITETREDPPEEVVVKEPGRSYFYTEDRNTKFPFSWIDNPWRNMDMKREELSLADKEVVDTLMKFNDKMPTKGLVRVRKKNLNLFQTLRKENATKARTAGNTKVPNLQDPLMEVHVHGGSKRKAEVPDK
ncbi:hypothetical protein DEO72_LG4g706 [Vigna unguiculata]|uniref:Uncharacterized protein n=1 Tax=Vigna unguiculata TaxID=3917 RepID=A0A4D6LMF3_VIGUN|nr:hypothetical protein DEO72_LG4g706 [Vigna unguiculata]